MRRIVLLVSGCLLIIACGLLVVAAYFLANQALAIRPEPRPIPGISPGPNPSVLPTLAATSTPPPTNSTLETLLSTELPANDPLQVGARLRKTFGTFSTPSTPVLHNVGDRQSFWVSREITGSIELVTATLRYVTPHSYMWLEDGEQVTDAQLKQAGDAFENRIYPTDRKYFGSEPNPGVDNDPHVYFLNTHFVVRFLGYYDSQDEYPKFVNRFSNEHEMMYMNVRAIRPGSPTYESVMAHEFAHMIHWNQNKREGSWITEGFGDLAETLNGFPTGHENSFIANPDTQLDGWTLDPNQLSAHYGAAYFFLYYLLNRLGDNTIRGVMGSGTHDIASIQSALDKNDRGLKFDDVFADWVVANYANGQALGPRYHYLDNSLELKPQKQYLSYPAAENTAVHQYGADYIDLEPAGHDVTFTFTGTQTVKAIPTAPHGGTRMWWGNRADQSDTSLTRSVDLTGVQKATLQFWTWYDIEPNFDYGYVEVSTDGGKTFTTLAGKSTTNRDPNGANYGNGLTCKSGSNCSLDTPPPQWIQEQMDLTPFTGQKILLRFEYITDAEDTGAGFALDDISIPEIGFSDDAESGDNNWQAQGFVRIDNILPQRFILQAIEYARDGSVAQIAPIPVDQANHASFTTRGLGSTLSHVVLVISGSTPITWEVANYSYRVQ